MNFEEITEIETVGDEIETEEVEEELSSSEESEEVETLEEAETPEEKSEEEEPKPDANEIAYLKAELDALKKELDESRAFYARLEGECTEFSELYPSVPLSSLPDSIWQSVKNGTPLAAAYALEARKTEIAAKRAEAVNGENRNMSSGALSSDSYNDFFTPAEVRAMTAAEVRANYTKIVNSMSKWH